ncbi:F0F1 ATP synthase subunit epsilon [Emcibacter nanhaiensis]|uniref:ATP synthase epsilon chain n=1 Tax=Emcibacter nanhaiensis TaxID=1505037 RepID=A0A501PN88_9PROT|nr:F0F1 ATP synthase subunit epsilon [Emcibacter nanhaiensis]TPD61628.1 F0F1 ATP synthase subunit epsilon [Emcibacter nanhaiensis]
MADKIHFELVSPEKLLLSEDADMVVVPGSEGDFGVMAHHAPVVSTLKTGIIEVHDGGSMKKLLVHGGFAEVNPNGLTILAEEAYAPGELDRAELEAELKDAREDVADAKDDLHRARAEKVRDRLVNILAALDELAA